MPNLVSGTAGSLVKAWKLGFRFAQVGQLRIYGLTSASRGP
jgi:hypothetical protein